MAEKTGLQVVDQARDGSLDNTEPVALRGVVTQLIAIGLALLVFKGYIEPEESIALNSQAIVIVGAVMSIVSTVGIVWQRHKAYSPQTAARIALTNSNTNASATLDVSAKVPVK